MHRIQDGAFGFTDLDGIIFTGFDDKTLFKYDNYVVGGLFYCEFVKVSASTGALKQFP